MLATRILRCKRRQYSNLSFSPVRFEVPVKQSFRAYASNAGNEELAYPESKSSNHHDLQSFLEHGALANLDPKSTVYVGTHYEYVVQSALESLGMSLKRIGGAKDNGVDLLGTWPLPFVHQPLKILVQCKAHHVVAPKEIRELEGAFVGAPSGWRGSGVLAFLVKQKPATKGVRDALGRSRFPMGYVLCNEDGKILQMLWNQTAAKAGLEGIGVELRYAGQGSNGKEVVLTWKGEPIKD